MELTNEERARVFAMYLGCNVQHDLGAIDKLLGVTFLDDSEGVNWFIKIGKDKKNNTWQIAHTHKLLLAPLSKISDEDAIEVGKLIATNWDGSTDDFILSSIGKIFIECYRQGRTSTYNQTAVCFIFQYLILKGYAVPLWFAPNHWANGKTALELEIAIEKQ